MDTAYEDKLDGTVSEEFWQRKSREWRGRRIELQSAIEQHQQAAEMYLEAGGKILRLTQRAHSLWLAQPQTEKRRLHDILLLNSTFDGRTLWPTYKKPFCWLAEGSLRSIWRG